MGWTYPYGATRRQIIDELTTNRATEDRLFETLKRCLRGNVMYCVHRSGTHGALKTWIGVYLLDRAGDGSWGYKDMDESMGPVYFDCPLSYLEMCDEPANENAARWRAEVRRVAAERAEQNAKKPKVGEVWSCHGRNCKRIRIAVVKGRRIEAYNLSGDGGYYRIPKKLLGERMAEAGKS